MLEVPPHVAQGQGAAGGRWRGSRKGGGVSGKRELAARFGGFLGLRQLAVVALSAPGSGGIS